MVGKQKKQTVQGGSVSFDGNKLIVVSSYIECR